MAIKEAFYGYLFVAPVVLGLAFFYSLPALISLGVSFTKWDGVSSAEFIGLDNFTALMKDDKFIRSIVNTLLYTIGTVPFSIALATLLAVLLNQKKSRGWSCTGRSILSR